MEVALLLKVVIILRIKVMSVIGAASAYPSGAVDLRPCQFIMMFKISSNLPTLLRVNCLLAINA